MLYIRPPRTESMGKLITRIKQGLKYGVYKPSYSQTYTYQNQGEVETKKNDTIFKKKRGRASLFVNLDDNEYHPTGLNL